MSVSGGDTDIRKRRQCDDGGTPVNGDRSDATVTAYDSRQVANQFVRLARNDSRSLSITQLLKLVYIAHGWHLALLDKPLILDFAGAWDHGPVVPNVYFSFRPQGKTDLGEFKFPDGVLPEIDEASSSIIQQTYDQYGGKSASALSALTHIDGGPWDLTRKKYGKQANIPNEWIREHYVDKARRAAQTS